MVNKIITNRTAVNTKYGDYADWFWSQVDKLIAADRQRNIITELVCVDDAQQMLMIKAEPVKDASDCKQNKEAVDAIYNGYNPHFMVLLGAGDIIPFQSLENPVKDKGDRDKDVPSDLPYACDAKYSRNITDFMAPTRQVTRLPDVMGSANEKTAAVFIQTVDRVISGYARDASDYQNAWMVNAQILSQTAQEYMSALYDDELYFDDYAVPPYNSGWGNDKYAARVQLHILHGGRDSNLLKGDGRGGAMPVAIEGEMLQGKLNNGTVSLIRACHAAQLYKPNTGGMPLANICLSSGSAAYLGSTNISVVNQYNLLPTDYLYCEFLKKILAGETVAAAMLRARLKCVQSMSVLVRAVEQKGFAQQVIYGYACANPVKGITMSDEEYEGCLREQRMAAEEFQNNLGYMMHDAEAEAPEYVKNYIADYLRERGEETLPDIEVYRVAGKERFWRTASEKTKSTRHYSVSLGEGDTPASMLLFIEESGEIVAVEAYVQNEI